MRDRVICRFETEYDLEMFNKSNGLDLHKDVLVYSFLSGIVKQKKRQSKKEKQFSTDKHECNIHWVGMPEYISNKQDIYAKIEFEFDGNLELAKKVFQQDVTNKTTSMWFPKLVKGKFSKHRVVGSIGCGHSKYPIYVVSKGRSKDCYTSMFLTNMEQYHYVVVEPSELDSYKKELENKYCRVIELDMSYKENYDTFDDLGDSKSKGPGGARNFCWEHSMKKGFKWHWVMDDNANEGFHYMWRNKKIKCRTASIFMAVEDFVDRYENIAIAGLNYSKFCKESDKTPPYVLNTRIYSFLLIRNDIPYRWRGRYNEDTDLSLRVLKDGWCTVQFNSFLAGKATTQKIKGGNTDEFYSHEGTLPKSKMLKDMHPDVTEVVYKFSRWHHQVDYSGFNQKLILKDSANLNDIPNVDNYGMVVISTDEEKTNDTKKYIEEKYLKNMEE